jgi:ATP-binding cassette subfamily B protein
VFTEAPRLKEFFDVLDTAPAVRDRPNAVDPGRVHGLVEFRDVSFSYDGKRPAVQDLTFVGEPGEIIALVGPTGAGKSTALALLYRAFDPQSGAITIDGMDIRDMKLAALRHNIGVVFQDGLLFNRSIAENLRIGKADASGDELRLAAERAQALDFIEDGRRGFDTRVGERGRLLSGGERQRLAIARVLLKNAPILILDEATSALDAKTESRLLAALDEVMKGRTTFVIAHRLATSGGPTRFWCFTKDASSKRVRSTILFAWVGTSRSWRARNIWRRKRCPAHQVQSSICLCPRVPGRRQSAADEAPACAAGGER